MPNFVYIATSLDGYIAREDGNIDWLLDLPNPGKSDYGFSVFLDTVDAILMGRKTFEIVLTLKPWPYPISKRVFVLTNSMSQLPQGLSESVEIVSGDLKQVIHILNSKGCGSLYVDGGKTIQGFLKEDLVDEMTITRVPVLLGAGISLFDKNNFELTFEHVSTEVFDNMLVKSKYIRKR